MGEIVQMGIHFENDIPALAAVPAIRPPLRDKFLAPEAAASVPAFPRLRPNAYPVDKHKPSV